MASTIPGDTFATFRVENLDREFRVIRFHGHEALSALYEVDVELAVLDTPLDFGEIVTRRARFVLNGRDGVRRLHGAVRQLVFLRRQGRAFLYRALLVPRLYWLGLGRDCRIFQNQSVTQIVATLLQQRGLPFRVRSDGNNDPPPRTTCVQYGESDLAFISRLLEETGYIYYFSQDQGSEVLEIVNDNALLPGISDKPVLPFVPPRSQIEDSEHIYEFTYGNSARVRQATLDDYNPLRPSLSLRRGFPTPDREPGFSKARIGSEEEIYEYPAGHELPIYGEALARIRQEEQLASEEQGRGRSNSPLLAAGHTFAIDGCPMTDLNLLQMVVLSVELQGETSQSSLEAEAHDCRCVVDSAFRCVCSAYPLRAARRTPRPRIHGVQTAVVVGPRNGTEAKDDIYTDALGRVKVSFRWDRRSAGDEQSSCWLRVAQAFAGAGFGSLWLPRVGHEVVVAFEEGDPDRPLIVGSLYHALNLPPFDLPGGKTRGGLVTRSTPDGKGYNELSFEDAKGKEQIRLHAQRDLEERVRRDHRSQVGGEQRVTVRRDQTVTIEEGDRRLDVLKGGSFEVVAGQRYQEVHKGRSAVIVEGGDTLELRKGNLEQNVQDGDRRVMIPDGNDVLIAKGSKLTRLLEGSYTIEIGGPRFVVKCGSSELILADDGTVTLKGTGGSLVMGASGITLKAGGAGLVDVTGTLITLNG